jgi:hypothetical protein
MIATTMDRVLQQRYPTGSGRMVVYLSLCRALAGVPEEADWASLSAGDWALFEAMAHREGVAPLLYYRLKTGGFPVDLPHSVRQSLAGAWLRSCSLSERMEGELGRLLLALSGLNGPVVLLKGGALAHSVYQQPGLRPMTDIDLLVSETDLADMVERLQKAGYWVDDSGSLVPGQKYLSHHTLMLSQHPGIPVEIHHRLVAGRNEDGGPDTSWFLGQVEPLLDQGGAKLWAFNAGAQLLHLALHLMVQDGEGESDLLHFYDIHLLVEKYHRVVDWSQPVEAARRMKLDYAVQLALEGCRVRFATDIPEELLQISRHPGGSGHRRMVDARRAARPSTHAGRYLRQLAGRPLATQVGLLVRFIFPRPEFMRQRYRLRPVWLWPLSYPVRWGMGLQQLAVMGIERLRRLFQ